MRPLPKLHLITNTPTQSRCSHYELVRQIPRHPEIAIQFREKQLDAEKHFQLKQVYSHCLELDILLIINDYHDVCAALPGTGIHVGINDAPLREVCTLLPDRVIGATAHDEIELLAAQRYPISYVGVGPIFATGSKQLAHQPIGLAGLERLCKKTALPVIAIGGITEKTAADVLQSGAYGIAVIGAWCNTSKPAAAIQGLLSAF